MAELNTHWTGSSSDDYLYRIGADYIRQLEEVMQASGINQAQLAESLCVTEGRVSQVLNNPGNLTLRKVIEYVRAIKKKVAMVVYDDVDPDNHNGPVSSQIFTVCWERCGKPTDFFSLNEWTNVADNASEARLQSGTVKYLVGQVAENRGVNIGYHPHSLSHPFTIAGTSSTKGERPNA